MDDEQPRRPPNGRRRNINVYNRVVSAPKGRKTSPKEEIEMKSFPQSLPATESPQPSSSNTNHLDHLPGGVDDYVSNNDTTVKRRQANLKFQDVVRKRIIQPEAIRNNKSETNNSEREPMKILKFSKLAKTLMTFRRNAVQDESHVNMQEQVEFFNKYGMNANTAHTVSQSSNAITIEGNIAKFIYSKLVVDSSADYYYKWVCTMSLAYLYNLLFVIFRCVFFEQKTIPPSWIPIFMVLDIITDIVYWIDFFVSARTGYLDQGLLVTDLTAIRKKYVKSKRFAIDLISVLPLDYLFQYAASSARPVPRFNRLLKLERMQTFISVTETRIRIPNAFRVACVIFYILVLIHWNACIYFLVSMLVGLGSDGWTYGNLNSQSLPPGVEDTIYRRYVYSFYWSTLILTTIGEVPGPVNNEEFAFVTLDLMCGVLIFATIVGNVGSMISNMSSERTEFQNRVDGIKQYMALRKVSKMLEVRVIKWFDYLWANKQSLADQHVLNVLPEKLQAEIAMHVHFETLRKVRIFQDCESGLLAELVLKLQQQVFSPGDYVCRKGDIGREMYIVRTGKLQVLNDTNTKVIAYLHEGSVFGELSILNIAGNKQGNRRSASIKSVGYSDLFALSKDHLWEALREYPDARRMLIQKGRELLLKDNLLDENLQEDVRSSEEAAEELQQRLDELRKKTARMIAEQVNQTTKLQKRIDILEKKLAKYEDVHAERDDAGDLSFYELRDLALETEDDEEDSDSDE